MWKQVAQHEGVLKKTESAGITLPGWYKIKELVRETLVGKKIRITIEVEDENS